MGDVVESKELERITAELEAEQEATERAALERGDADLPSPPDGDVEPELPDDVAAAGLAVLPSPPAGELEEPAEDQDGGAEELSDDELTLLYGGEELDPPEPVEDAEDYDPLTSKPAGFR